MSQKIREPGKSFDLTDEEILRSPARMLNAEQRQRRRNLKRRKKAEAAARTADQIANGERNPTCQGTNRAGNPCKSYAVRGAKHCMGHLNDAEKAKLGMKSLSEHGIEAKRIVRSDAQKGVTPLAVMRQVAETAAEKILARQFSPLGMEFKGFDEEGNPIVIDHGAEAGIRLHGVSKEGDVVVSSHADLASQFNIAEKLWDRLYGKPRQTTVLEGGQRPVQVQPVQDVDRAKKVASMLHQVGAIPREHEGRRRSQPSEPAKTSQEPSNVTPLHK